uniref:Uncharacterized protein n=1 Tax=Cannabis sativa TaxID=3483 RepID=A0A803NJK5_CANSA
MEQRGGGLGLRRPIRSQRRSNREGRGQKERGRRGLGTGKNSTKKAKPKKIGPTSWDMVIKTKYVDEILAVMELEIPQKLEIQETCFDGTKLKKQHETLTTAEKQNMTRSSKVKIHFEDIVDEEETDTGPTPAETNVKNKFEALSTDQEMGEEVDPEMEELATVAIMDNKGEGEIPLFPMDRILC